MSRRLILIYVMFLTNTVFRFCTKLRHLTYWLKWRVHSAIIGGSTCADATRSGGHVSPPLRWVTINEMNECIDCADATRSGGHVGLLKKYLI